MKTSFFQHTAKLSLHVFSFLLFSGFAHSALSQRLLEYRNQVPAIDYGQSANDVVTELFSSIDDAEFSVAYGDERGYLDDLLQALEVSPTSQVLVFSKTALKGRLISPDTPRAIYFNDNVYVAFVAGTPSLEVASMDPLLGPVFYEIPLEGPDEDITLRRHTSRCLNCHVKNYMTDGGVPLFMLQSSLVDRTGEIYMLRDSEIITDISTPLELRWGGWYVTGQHGDQRHRGNLTFASPPNVNRLEISSRGNLTTAEELFDSTPYMTPYSDIVALLVMQHQIDVQNEIARVNYQVRSIVEREGGISETELAEKAEPLLQALFLSGETPLTEEVSGSSGFTDYFQALGPVDSQGRSLRDFDLENRIFSYPLSYQIYSEAFNALPEQVLDYLGRRIGEVLTGEDQSSEYSHLSTLDRSNILAILQETKPGLINN